MAFQAFYQQLEDLIQDCLKSSRWSGAIEVDRLISPHRLQLKSRVAETATAAIRAHHELIQNSRALDLAKADSPEWLWKFESPLDSPLMAYDFHTTAEGDCQLIEVNTNAAAFLLSCLAAQAHGLEPSWNGMGALKSLEQSFRDHAQACSKTNEDPNLFLVVDENIQEQKMRMEFFLFESFFKSQFRAEALVVDANDLNSHLPHGSAESSTTTFIYNRLTDFFLENPALERLKSAYQSNTVILAPHPKAYAAFADKRRLTELSQAGQLETLGATGKQCEALRKVLIPSYKISDFKSIDEIWQNRKKLFFKPRQSYGGKSVYRGESVSRKVFERLVGEDIVIQKFVPAQSWPISESEDYLSNWKFDLRFYVYKGEIQLAVARAYQGQVTNFSSQFGGLTTVTFA